MRLLPRNGWGLLRDIEHIPGEPEAQRATSQTHQKAAVHTHVHAAESARIQQEGALWQAAIAALGVHGKPTCGLKGRRAEHTPKRNLPRVNRELTVWRRSQGPRPTEHAVVTLRPCSSPASRRQQIAQEEARATKKRQMLW